MRRVSQGNRAQLPDRIRQLQVQVNESPCGDLLHESQLVFKYRRDDELQPRVGLLMPASRMLYRSNALFPSMDQNLPEGYLLAQMRAMFPKQQLGAMQILALMGDNGIGRLGFALEGWEPCDTAPGPEATDTGMTRRQVLEMRYSEEVFEDLVRAYLSRGCGIAGVQPKIMLVENVPDRATIPVPTMIVKAGSESYPGLAANEYLCLSAAKLAGIETPSFDLSEDGQMLVIDRFDLRPDGKRHGFEDIAAVMGLNVRDTLSDRKYVGSYEAIADTLKAIGLGATDLARFFEQVAFTVMVRNGDGHLKNFGVLYDEDTQGRVQVRLAPMFDVLSTAIYRYRRWSHGPDLEDRTMALKFFRGRHASRTYPTTEELLRFGRDVCHVVEPAAVLRRIAEAMDVTLAQARRDERVPGALVRELEPVWRHGMAYWQEASTALIAQSHAVLRQGRPR